jgi:hypothetical protein
MLHQACQTGNDHYGCVRECLSIWRPTCSFDCYFHDGFRLPKRFWKSGISPESGMGSELKKPTFECVGVIGESLF